MSEYEPPLGEVEESLRKSRPKLFEVIVLDAATTSSSSAVTRCSAVRVLS